jgi:hypothetical protein
MHSTSRPLGTSTLLLGLAFLLGACSSDDNSAGTSGGNAGAGGSAGAGGGTGETGGSSSSGSGDVPAGEGSTMRFDGSKFEASITARNVAPGEDEHVCVILEMPTDERVFVSDVQATLRGGSHHLIVDRYDVSADTKADPYVCPPTQGGEATRLIIAQQTETLVSLPEGVAFAIEARQKLFLQLHYLNVTSEPMDITGEVTLHVAELEDPVEARSLFTGSFAINLPPHSPGRSEAFIVPAPDQGSTRHVFALTSHTHRLGVRSTIERVPLADAPETDPIHTSLDWSEPPLDFYSPPLEFIGQDGLRLVCEYENTTDQTVGFGTLATQEMCFMWVYYYDR